MRRPVIIASILALLSACDKPQESAPAPAATGPLTELSATSTVLFKVFGPKDEARLAPIAVVQDGKLAPLVLDRAGWQTLDSLFFVAGRTLPLYRNGNETGTVAIVRGMWNSDEGPLYSLPACRDVVPQAAGKLSATGFVEASVEYLASTTPLKQTAAGRAMPGNAETQGRTLANAVATASEVGQEELSGLEFIARWLPTGAGPSGRTLLASYIDPAAGDAGPGAGHTVMVMVFAEDSAGALATTYQHVSAGESRTVEFQRLLNHADLDGDGVDELLLEQWHYAAVPEVAVLKYAQGKWREVFRISANWCLDARAAAP